MTDTEWAQVFTVHRKWINAVIKRQYRPERELSKDDLRQAACLSIWENRHKYNPAKGAITTWLYVYARHGIQMAYGRARHNRNPVLESDLEGQSTNERDKEWRPQDPYDFRDLSDSKLFLTAVAQCLSELETRVVSLMLQDMGHTDIAKQLGVSRQYVEQICTFAITKIQRNQQVIASNVVKRKRVCLQCGKVLNWKNKKYCSHACHNKHHGYRVREALQCA